MLSIIIILTLGALLSFIVGFCFSATINGTWNLHRRYGFLRNTPLGLPNDFS
jgi:hypothetical protein